jgi:hypothetical protein
MNESTCRSGKNNVVNLVGGYCVSAKNEWFVFCWIGGSVVVV